MSSAKGQAVPKPEALKTAEQRVALEALRAAALAVHNAAGLCRAAQLPLAARTSRVAEGMVRSAISLVQAAAGKAPAASVAQAAASGAQATAEKKKKEKNIAKGKDKGKDLVSQDMDTDAPRGRARLRGRPQPANAASLVLPSSSEAPCDCEIDDAWADGLSGRGLGAASRAAAARPPPSPAGPPGADTKPLGATQAPRRGAARASHSRSPRREASHGSDAAGSSPAAEAHLVKGAIASIKRLDARPDLGGALVELVDYDSAAGRWRCKLQSGESLRILPAKLQGVLSKFQDTTRRRFEGGE